MSPFDLFRAWTIKNAKRLGYNGPTDDLPLALDTVIISIMSFILESGAYLSDDGLVRDLAGVHSFQVKHTDSNAMVTVLSGILKQWWSQWSITRRRDVALGCATEHDIPDSIVQQYLKLDTLPDAFLASPNAREMLATCLDMLRMWPHGVLCRAAILPSYSANPGVYRKTVCVAAVDAFYATTYSRIFLAHPDHVIMDNLLIAVRTAVTECLQLPHAFEPFSHAAIFTPSPEDVQKYDTFSAYAYRMPTKEWQTIGYTELELSGSDAEAAVAETSADAGTDGLGDAPDHSGGGAGGAKAGRAGRGGGGGGGGRSAVRAGKAALRLPPSVALPRSTNAVHPVFEPTVSHYNGDTERVFRALDDVAREKALGSVQGLGDHARGYLSSKAKAVPSVDARGGQTIPEDLLASMRLTHSLTLKYIAHFYSGQTPEDREAGQALLLSKFPLPGVAATPEELEAFLEGTAGGDGQAGIVRKAMQPADVQSTWKSQEKKRKQAESGSSRAPARKGATPDSGTRSASASSGVPRTATKAGSLRASARSESSDASDPSSAQSSLARRPPPRIQPRVGGAAVERGRAPRTLSSGPPTLVPVPPVQGKAKRNVLYKSDEFVCDDSSLERAPAPAPSLLPLGTPAAHARLPVAHGKGVATGSDGGGTSDTRSAVGSDYPHLPALSRAVSPDASSGGSRASSSKRRQRSPSKDGSPAGEKDEPAKKKTKTKKGGTTKKKEKSRKK
ncbi:hypothetical protein FB107DRAFT_280249 [Schizophyllum commune]